MLERTASAPRAESATPRDRKRTARRCEFGMRKRGESIQYPESPAAVDGAVVKSEAGRAQLAFANTHEPSGGNQAAPLRTRIASELPNDSAAARLRVIRRF